MTLDSIYPSHIDPRNQPEGAWEKHDTMLIKITTEEWQVIWSALSCASKETKDSVGSTLVDCAKQIVGLHMNGHIEAEVNYTDGILNIMDSTNWKEE